MAEREGAERERERAGRVGISPTHRERERLVLVKHDIPGSRVTPHADGWFHEWIHTLEYGPQGWERPCASHPGHTGYDTTHWFESDDSEYQAVGRNLQSYSPRRG